MTRVPAVILALAIIILRLIATLVSASAYAVPSEFGSFARAASAVSDQAIDPALMLALTVLVASCVLVDPPARVRALTRVSIIVVAVSIAATVVLALIGINLRDRIVGVDTVSTILYLAVPLLSLVFLVRLFQLLTPADQVGARARRAETGTDPAGARSDSAVDQPAATPPDPDLQPTWAPDAAAGAAWHSAGEAAAGAPASGWGTDGADDGWGSNPDPGSAASPEDDTAVRPPVRPPVSPDPVDRPTFGPPAFDRPAFDRPAQEERGSDPVGPDGGQGLARRPPWGEPGRNDGRP